MISPVLLWIFIFSTASYLYDKFDQVKLICHWSVENKLTDVWKIKLDLSNLWNIILQLWNIILQLIFMLASATADE